VPQAVSSETDRAILDSAVDVKPILVPTCSRAEPPVFIGIACLWQMLLPNSGHKEFSMPLASMSSIDMANTCIMEADNGN